MEKVLFFPKKTQKNLPKKTHFNNVAVFIPELDNKKREFNKLFFWLGKSATTATSANKQQNMNMLKIL